jgi:hypothetical protein
MKLPLALLAVCLVARSGSAQSLKLSDLAWMEGCWEINRATSRTIEKWGAIANGQIAGESHTFAGGFERANERLRLIARGDTIIYEATPSGQARTEFRLQPFAGEYVFANPDHDFPQRIVYKRVGTDSMIARIEGDRAGRRAPVTYPFRKATCPASFEAPGAVIEAALQKKYDDLVMRETGFGGATNGWLADNAGEGFSYLNWTTPGRNPSTTTREALARANESFKANPNRLGFTNRQFAARVERILLRSDDLAEVMVAIRHVWNFVDTTGTSVPRGTTRLRESLQRRLDRWERAGTDWRLREVQIINDETYVDGRLTFKNGRTVNPDSGRSPSPFRH